MIDPKWIVELQGKAYVLYAGLLAEAHDRGLLSIDTELLQLPAEENAHTAVARAVVTMTDGSRFEEFGDASPRNVAPKLVNALPRMALTRAKGRALRDAVNVGVTMMEELGEMEETRGDKWQREMPAEKFGASKAEIAGTRPEPMKVRYSPGTPEGDAALAGAARRQTGSGMAALGDVAVTNCVVCNKMMNASQVTWAANQKPPIDPPAHATCIRGGA